MKIFSTGEINAIIQHTLREKGLSELQFIDAVGEALAFEVISAIIPGHKLVMFAGPERNGAYALATARHLFAQGYTPFVYLFNNGGRRLNEVCRKMRDLLVETCSPDILHEFVDQTFTPPEISGEVMVIDGLFGTERTTPLQGGYQSMVNYINENASRVISIEIPSGLIVDTTEALLPRMIIHATITLAIGMPRLEFFLKEYAELIGRWKIVPIDLSKSVLDGTKWKYRLIEKKDIRRLLPTRDLFESKADAGEAIIFAGSYGMTGAAVLAAKGALRAGCGKVTVHGPRCNYFVVQTAVPCALFDTDEGDVAITRFEVKRNYNAIAVGPGIGTADSTIDSLDRFFKLCNANSRPLVIDADALNCIAIRPDMLNHIPVMSVITPHAGEFDRLFGSQPTGYARLLKAIQVAEQRKIVIVLKGRFTAVVRPDGKVSFNPTGSPALATAGTGDVLTGVLTSFIARGMKPELAAVAAPYIHGLAGDIAAKTHGSYGVIASDVADNIGRAIKTINE